MERLDRFTSWCMDACELASDLLQNVVANPADVCCLRLAVLFLFKIIESHPSRDVNAQLGWTGGIFRTSMNLHCIRAGDAKHCHGMLAVLVTELQLMSRWCYSCSISKWNQNRAWWNGTSWETSGNAGNNGSVLRYFSVGCNSRSRLFTRGGWMFQRQFELPADGLLLLYELSNCCQSITRSATHAPG